MSSDTEYVLQRFKHLGRRSILPLLPRPGFARFAAVTDDLPDVKNVQGDVIYLFPKAAENFIFFRINNVVAFKAALKLFRPTSSEDVIGHLDAISEAKAGARARGLTSVPTVDIKQYQIAFSRTGMYALGVQEDTGDARFDKHCMADDRKFLGDQGKWDPIFDKPATATDPVNGSVHNDNGALHGVVTVAGSSADTCTKASNDVIKLFGKSITVVQGKPLEGRARPAPYRGHEHFGFKDGISQPAIRGLVTPRNGQIQVDPGVIIMGYPGDPVRDDPNIKVKRPAWTRDGTILVFRKLEQLVVSFDDYLARAGPRWREFIPGGDISPPLSVDEAKGLFGARLVGRWKSGAPVAKCPFRDNKAIADDPEQNNGFDYVVRDNPKVSSNEPSDYYCPFNAHTRKTAPRNLDPYINSKYLESGSIVRGGLPYGGEVIDQERQDFADGKPEVSDRGLLFNCYMSSLDSGFIRQTIGYAGNDFWPMTSLVPQKKGQDPILGSPPANKEAQFAGTVPSYNTGDRVDLLLTGENGATIEVSGFANVIVQGAQPPPGEPNPYFVNSRGGEYFFVPSISTLQSWADATNPTKSKLDILFLLDTTGSMQVYIDQVRDTIQQLCDTLVATGGWSGGDLRFGLQTFRDHPPQEDTYITRAYPFNSDAGAIQSNLANIQAEGGGDGPEAQCEAFAGVLKAPWKDEATKMAILITDSPPHGIGEDEDRFPKGCPLQNDPVRSVSRMARLGIILHVLACEPTLSMDYSTPLDFYKAMVKKTGGKFLPLADATSLLDLIVGGVLETADVETLAVKYKADIHQQAAQNATVDTITRALQGRLASADVRVNTLDVEDIYVANSQGDDNVQAWFNAEEINDDTLSQIKGVREFRVKQAYRQGGTPAINTNKAPVSLSQVETAVRMCLNRGA